MPLDLPQTASAIVAMTNAFRAEHKVGAVTASPKLEAAAQAYGKLLANQAALSHTADGRTPGDRAQSAGYGHCQIAENLARHEDSRGFVPRDLAARAVDGWKASPGHRRNLLASGMTDIGVAVVPVPGRDPAYVSVQLFGRPKSLQFKIQIANVSGAPAFYNLGGEDHDVAPRTVVTHTACGAAALAIAAKDAAGRRYRAEFEARDGLRYTIKGVVSGAMTVDVAPGR